MRTSTDGRLPGGLGFPLGGVAVVAATIVADLAGATRHPGYALAALALVVLAAASMSTPAAVAGTALVAWAVDTGFVLGRAGGLVFDAASGQVALVLGAVAAAGVVAAAIVRAARRRVAGPRLALRPIPAPRSGRSQPVADRIASA
ncbi:hypothetical protein [Amycolatopsis sp. PS_44_ISF1]|uniref:hypothetical protein n=1 Tax=Amycolatopsis sp. PS_44_ISF1 TaxID=2974917 RepID=UPI0028DF3AC1|nr:hypothetical protein [Amycolatopsis sp. PS_44_ISF1]MDT8912188.1 hypothetical protein [Amycolatopsis sp. PS_44_ISF1]